MPPPTTTATAKARHVTLALYRSCLRSVKRIPEPDHRLEYTKYVRQGFRDKVKLVQGSSQARAALEGAWEQLERMNYYHSIREAKEQQKEKSGANNNEITENPTKSDTKSPTATVIHVIHQWLEKALPQLSDQDKDHYTSCLLEDGFDSIELLSKDLVLDQDLAFMKKGHQRAIRRTYFQE